MRYHPSIRDMTMLHVNGGTNALIEHAMYYERCLAAIL